jgi:hypothetical protein
MKTKKNMGNNIRSSPLSVTCNRSFAACLVKHHANDCNPEGISARRIAGVGRYGELTITAIMCIDRLCVAEEILTWEIATNIE